MLLDFAGKPGHPDAVHGSYDFPCVDQYGILTSNRQDELP